MVNNHAVCWTLLSLEKYKISHLMMAASDVDTDREIQQLREKLRTIERRKALYESAMNALADGIRITDQLDDDDGKEVFTNEAWKKEASKPLVQPRYLPSESSNQEKAEGFRRTPLANGELHLKLLADQKALHKILDNIPAVNKFEELYLT